MKFSRIFVIVSILTSLSSFQNCSPVNFNPTPEMIASLAIASSCPFNGQTIPDNGTITTYASPTVAFGNSCLSETRTCHNGFLTGSFTASSCVVAPPANCTLNGQTILDGTSSPLVYESPTVPFGSVCNSQYRICSNGNLSGSFTAPSCTVLPQTQFPPLPPSGVNVHIQCYVSAAWFQTLRVTTADGVAHDYPMGSGNFAAPPLDVVYSSPPVSFQAFHYGSENAYRWPSPYTGVTSNSVAFETEDGYDYDYNDLDCYFSW
jgi:hypothetical protein